MINLKSIFFGICFGIVLVGAICISGCVSSSSHAVTLSFHDRFGNSLSGATVTASPIQSTIFENTQSGGTDSSGNVVFSMVSTRRIQYHCYISWKTKNFSVISSGFILLLDDTRILHKRIIILKNIKNFLIINS